MSLVDEIRNQALGLSPSDRAALARDLLLSLEDTDFDDDGGAAWAAEIEARSTAVETGNFTASPWRESVQRVRRFLAEKGG